MSKIFVFLLMLFFHVLDDFVLQKMGCLAFLKQREYWEKEAPDEKYKNDYKVALLAHSISWAFMIMLPVFMYKGFNVDINLLLLFAVHVGIHYFIDNEKANHKSINLVKDQFIHLLQIITIFFVTI